MQTHEALKPLLWLVGRWKSIVAEGDYPNLTPFSFYEEITFESVGQPMLNYTSRTWHPEKNIPMHLESGFLRIKPGTNEVAFMVAHNFGLTTIEEGTVTNHELKCKSVLISRMSFAKEPTVISTERVFKLDDDGHLDVTTFMATDRTPLTQHLHAVYKRCE